MIAELERLVVQRERVILLAERVRIPANRYTYLRNMSVFRQYMLDLLHYFRCEVAAGRRPQFDVCDWSQLESRAAAFLR